MSEKADMRRAVWVAVDDHGHREVITGEFIKVLAEFGARWATRLDAGKQAATRKVNVTSPEDKRSADFTVDYVPDGKAS
jgi:hypothetical protein